MSKDHLLTADSLRAMLDYSPSTGLFTWKKNRGSALAGSNAGNINSNGYLTVGLIGGKFRLHRLVWLHYYGHWPVGTVDHLNGLRTDNRLCNLRDVPQCINMQNRRSPSKSNVCGVLGVYWSDRRNGFMASIKLQGKQKRRGPYKTKERAYSAYIDMKRVHHEGCTL